MATGCRALTPRRARETAILTALAQGPASAVQIAQRVYTDTPTALLPAATRNVLAHLIDLMGKSRVTPQGPLTGATLFAHQQPL